MIDCIESSKNLQIALMLALLLAKEKKNQGRSNCKLNLEKLKNMHSYINLKI